MQGRRSSSREPGDQLPRLVPYRARTKPRTPGLWRGQGRMADDFDAPIPELLDAFEFVILLLDAHVLLWWLFDDANLRASARRAIADPATDVLISAATIWEIAIKRELGRLRAPDDLVAAISASEFDILPVTGIDAEAAAASPRHLVDPFDRMLVAHAERIGCADHDARPCIRGLRHETLPA